MLAEVGVVGTALFLAVLIAVAAPLLRIWRRSSNRTDVTIAVGLLLGLGGYLLAGLFLDLAYARYFWLLIGLAVAAGVILAPERATDSTLAPASALDAGDAVVRR